MTPCYVAVRIMLNIAQTQTAVPTYFSNACVLQDLVWIYITRFTHDALAKRLSSSQLKQH